MTSKEALEIIGNIDIDGRYPYPNHLKHRYKKEYDIIMEELEKKEKLLELYEALAIVKDDMLSYCEVVDDDYYDSKELATSFEKQIKELE